MMTPELASKQQNSASDETIGPNKDDEQTIVHKFTDIKLSS